MYFVALNPGHWKIYNTPRDSFWCCTGTGMENHAKYGDSIYFHDDESLYVNLFIPSVLNWAEKGVRVEQQTKFPESDRTLLIFHCDEPVELTLRIRCPYWTTGDVEILHSLKSLSENRLPSPRLRGEGLGVRGFRIGSKGGATEPLLKDDGRLPIPGLGYFTFRRQWQDGERVEIRMPMKLHLDPMPDDPTLATIMYGPLVLAGELGTEKLTPDMFYAKRQRDYDNGPSIEVPILVVREDAPEKWIEPVPDRPLAFRTVGVGRPNDVTLIPYHMLFGQRYSVYWRIVREGSEKHREIVAEQEARRARLARTVDSVAIGDRTSEEEHELQGENTQAGFHQGRMWRHATGGGWFSYSLSVLADVPMTLSCTYWGSDAGARTFDVLIDGEKVATQTLDRDKPNQFFGVEYELPPELTRGKAKVTVKFQGHPGNFAGGVFGCEMLKPAE